jgi:exonuclease SbcC
VRPELLRMWGVRSYPNECEIPFTGKRLVAILGDTGGGKTTILHSITLALYGRPLHPGLNLSDLITTGLNEMTVVFEFSVDGRSWRAQRTMYRSGEPSKATLQPVADHAPSEKVHGSDNVTEAVTQLIGLNRQGFIHTALLPQGKSNAILTAAPGDRAKLLRHIFGIDELHRVRKHTLMRLEVLKARSSDAEKARNRLFDDPVAEEARAASEMERTRALADRRRARLTLLRTAQEEAGKAKQRKAELDTAARRLRTRATADAETMMAELTQSQNALATEAELLDSAEHKLLLRAEAARTALKTAAQAGHTLKSLTSACALLSRIPQRTEDLNATAQRLKQEQLLLQAHEQETEQAREKLTEREKAQEALAEAVRQAEGASNTARSDTDKVHEAVRSVLHEASASAAALQAHRTTLESINELQTRGITLQRQRDHEKAALDAAQAELDALRVRDAAHAAGSDLSPGDACPVCEQSVPSGFTPPEPSGGTDMRRAKEKAREQSNKFDEAHKAREQSKAAMETARRDSAAYERAVDNAHARVQAALEEVQELAVAIKSVRAPEVARVLKDLTQQTADQAQALSGGEPMPQADLARTANDVVRPLRDADQDALTEYTRAQKLLFTAEAENSAARDGIERAHKRLKRERGRLERAQQQYQNDVLTVREDIAGLPASLRPESPAPGQLPDTSAIIRAKDTAEELLPRLEQHEHEHEEAREALASLAEKRQALQDRRRLAVEAPTRALLARLQRWSDAATEAAEVLGDRALFTVPPAVDEGDLSRVGAFAAELDSVGAQLSDELKKAARQAAARVRQFERELIAQAGAPADADDPDPGFHLPSKADLLSRAALDELGRKTNEAENAHKEAEKKRRKAQSQIPHAQEYAAAQEEAEQQIALWQRVCHELTDSRYLKYLTDRHTRALLTHAGRILHELTAGAYRFTDDFRIREQATNIVRDAGTLSGGETFQASLALALALVELHSRSHSQLECLFLDEGFASLDGDHLETALDALRSSVLASDRTIVAISHLYSIADAVNDVLLVEKTSRESRTRWLKEEQREQILSDGVQQLQELL